MNLEQFMELFREVASQFTLWIDPHFGIPRIRSIDSQGVFLCPIQVIGCSFDLIDAVDNLLLNRYDRIVIIAAADDDFDMMDNARVVCQSIELRQAMLSSMLGFTQGIDEGDC